MKRTQKRIPLEQGFTLVEIMVVLVIIGLLGAFLFGKIFDSGEAAKARMAQLKLAEIQRTINQFKLMYNQLPNELDDLGRCTDVTGPGCIPLVKPNDDTLVDPWGQKFVYSRQGSTFKVVTLGADGRPGGEGVNFDHGVEGP